MNNEKIKEELKTQSKKYSIDRLINLLIINLEMLSHQINREDLYDKNDNYLLLQDIISISLVIKKRIKSIEKNKK